MTAFVVVEEQPVAFVVVSERRSEPTDPAVNVTFCAVAPDVIVPLVIDHAYEAAPDGPLALFEVEAVVAHAGAVNVESGRPSTVTTTGCDVAVQLPSPVVTLYAPGSVTVIDRDVAPFDHTYVLPPFAVKVTRPPGQNVTGPSAVMVGADTEQTGVADSTV